MGVFEREGHLDDAPTYDRFVTWGAKRYCDMYHVPCPPEVNSSGYADVLDITVSGVTSGNYDQ